MSYNRDKIREAVRLYDILKQRENWKYEIDIEEAPRNWIHPAEVIDIIEPSASEPSLRIFTDGSKSEQDVGLLRTN